MPPGRPERVGGEALRADDAGPHEFRVRLLNLLGETAQLRSRSGLVVDPDEQWGAGSCRVVVTHIR
jgi:hypothetical protein